MKGNKKSLYRQIIILLIVAILVPLGVVSGINYYNINKDINESFEAISSKQLEQVIDFITNTNKNIKESVEMLSQDPNTKAMLVNPDSSIWFKNSLKAFLDSHKDISSVYMGLNNGAMILVPEQELPKGYDARERGWYKKALENKGSVIITDPYEDVVDNKKYDVTFAKTVEDASGNVVGVIGIDIVLDKLSKKVSEIIIGQNGYAEVIDAAGTIIAHKNTEKIGKTSKEDNYIEGILKNEKSVLEQEVDNVNYVVFKEKDEDTGYTILSLVPKKELTDKVLESAIFNVSAALVLFSTCNTYS